MRLDLIGGFQAHNALVAAGLAIGSGSDAGGGARRAAGAADGARPDGAGGDAGERRRGLRRLCPHSRRADHGADRAPAARDGAAHRRLRRRRRPRPRQAAADGRGGGGGGGRRLRHRRQPAHRGRRRRSAPRCCEGAPEATEIGDRAEAILTAVDALQPGDALLIAGKGHETGQIVGQDILPFDDIEQASVAVAALDGLGA